LDSLSSFRPNVQTHPFWVSDDKCATENCGAQSSSQSIGPELPGEGEEGVLRRRCGLQGWLLGFGIQSAVVPDPGDFAILNLAKKEVLV
jgi:hypothetical protein